MKVHDKRFKKASKTDAEVEICIINNSKHAQYIKELKFTEELEPERAIQLFETFKFITNLTIRGVTMSQDQFISIIIPLTQLQELNLSYLGIKKIIKKRLISVSAVLPPSLTKLNLDHVNLYKNPELFIQTINSHTNLIQYKFSSYDGDSFLGPFFKNYPSLKIFEYKHEKMDHSQPLIKVFESNSQLKALKLSLSWFNDALMSNLSRYLTNLEEFDFNELNSYHEGQTSIISKFTHPTKIKKLNLNWSKLSQCSINSTLLNCPYLEELCLNYSPRYQNTVSDIIINPSKLANIKILTLYYCDLSINSYNSIIMKCAQIKELNIILPKEWKEFMKMIESTCTNLEYLIINPPRNIQLQERDEFYHEFCNFELLASNSLYKSTLTHLVLCNFNIYESNAEYFKNLSKLKCIEYLYQRNSNGPRSETELDFYKDLWPSYRIETKVDKYHWDAKLVKLNS